jgi:hypothetical protein
MIKTGLTLVERIAALQIWELVDANKRPSHQPDDVMEGAGVLVNQRL